MADKSTHNSPSFVKMSSFVRIRLSFQRSLPLAETQNCWFLFDTAKCSTIADLEYLIKVRFEGLKSGNNVINLYLDEYLLPSQEKIELIQQNDNIRVELKQITTKWSSEEDESYQDTEEKVKRKKKNSVLPDVSQSKQTSKKMSPSPSTSHVTTQNKSNEKSKGKNSKISEKKHKTSHPPPTQPSKSNVGKRKNNDEPLKTNAKISKTSTNKMEKDLHAGKDVVGCDCYSTESSSSTVSSSSSSSSDELHSKACALMNGKKSAGSKATKDDKSSVHGVLGKDVKNKLSSTFVSPKGNKRKDANKIASKSSSALQGKNKGNCASKSSSSSSESSETEESESTPKGNKRKDANRIASKSLSALQGKNKGNCASKASSSSSESSETEESESILKRDATKTNISSLSSSLSASLTSPRLSSEGVKECAKIGNTYKKKSVDMIRKDNIKKKVSSSSYYSASSSSSSSENEKDDSNIEDIYKNTDTLLYPLSSSSLPLPSSSSSSDGKQWDTTVTSVNQSVRSNLNQKAECSGQVNVLQRTSKTQKEKTGTSLSTSHIRFDSEDETIDEQEEVCSINNVTDDCNSTRPDPSLTASKQNDQMSSKNAVEQKEPAQKDYSVCTPLHGPPRNKDKIAYKVVELSASYTPEVSAYKEGTVLSYEPNSGAVTIELTKESLKKTQGDGNVSRKFELVYEDDQENEENVNDEEPDPETQKLEQYLNTIQDLEVKT